MTGRLDTETIARARAVPVADEIHRRRIPLRRVGLELVGACPVCGDGGKGARSDRFAVCGQRLETEHGADLFLSLPEMETVA
jgi:hypothetical protein